jgi:imidazolonepropionase
MPLLITNARTLTLATGSRPRRGPALADLSILPAADVLIENDRISVVESSSPRSLARSLAPPALKPLDAAGRLLLPAFIDAHTHACYVGERLDEWQMKLAGKAYLDILNAGGGIMSTVRRVRAASQQQLTDALLRRIRIFLAHGTTTIEVKSGYGLSTTDELKMLRAIVAAGQQTPATIIPTALLGHALDPALAPDDFVARTINETLPAVHAEYPTIAIDAYCEKGAWSLEQTLKLYDRARSLGHPIRVHADQFNSLGIIPALCVPPPPHDGSSDRGARPPILSIDHLEAATDADLQLLAASDTFAVALPVAGLHLSTAAGGAYANLRRLADLGGVITIATNHNPGSAPTYSMPLALAAAVRFCGLSPAEAIVAATVNPATLLGLHDRGVIAPGQRADLVLLRHTDERELAYELGGNPVEAVICGGQLLP